MAIRLAPRVRVISLVREPMARNYSMFFQYLDRFIFQARQLERIEDTDRLLQYAFDTYLDHDVVVNWFDQEFKEVLGVDVCACGKRGERLVHIDNGRVEVLVLKLEALEMLEATQPDVARFLGLRTFQFVRENDSNRKFYRPLYKAFKESILLPSTYLDRLYGAPYLRCFYNDDELRSFRKKWMSDVDQADGVSGVD